MAQFPMGGYFNRPRQNFPHHGQFPQSPQMPGHGMMGNMHRPMQMPMQAPGFPHANQNPYHPQQNVPRGTSPQNFGRQQHPNTNMPQQMPPMNMLNPTNDPNVRFEPIPNGMVPPGGAPPQNSLQAPQVSPALSSAAELIIMLSSLTQGESNSITFYENMARSSAVSGKDRELVEELLSNKRRQMESVSGLYRSLTNSEWASAKDIKVEETRNYRADIAYALLQESRLLREASQIYANLDDAAHQRTMNTMLHNKVADIAHLMSL